MKAPICLSADSLANSVPQNTHNSNACLARGWWEWWGKRIKPRKKAKESSRENRPQCHEWMTAPPQGEHPASTSGLLKQLMKATVKKVTPRVQRGTAPGQEGQRLTPCELGTLGSWTRDSYGWCGGGYYYVTILFLGRKHTSPLSSDREPMTDQSMDTINLVNRWILLRLLRGVWGRGYLQGQNWLKDSCIPEVCPSMWDSSQKLEHTAQAGGVTFKGFSCSEPFSGSSVAFCFLEVAAGLALQFSSL